MDEYQKLHDDSCVQADKTDQAEITFTWENKDLERGDEKIDLHGLVKDELYSRTKSPPPSIYRVPGILRNLSPSSFDPRIVSIGPLHRDNKNLKAFETKKVRCVYKLLERVLVQDKKILEDCTEKENVLASMKEILDGCRKEVLKSMEKIKACYVLPAEKYSDDELAEMMVMDACFILGFIFWRIDYEDGKLSEDIKLSYAIYSDLVLLENQIPFFVLKQIYKCLCKYSSDKLLELNVLIIKILNAVMLLDIPEIKGNILTETPSHILSLLHEYYKPPSKIKPVSDFDYSFRSTVDLALSGVNIETDNPPEDLAFSRVNIETDNPPEDLALSGKNIETDNPPEDLALSGVKIKTDNSQKWELQIKVKKGRFHRLLGSWSKHTLIVPKLWVTDFTEVILRNLIAYEQTYPTDHNYITSYAFAMDMLVNDRQDVANLVKSNALRNDLGSNKEVAKMINGICKNVICEEFFYMEHCKTLDEYCNAYWPEHIAWFRRNKFNSPWSIIGLVAGFILFAIAVTNTILSIISRIQ